MGRGKDKQVVRAKTKGYKERNDGGYSLSRQKIYTHTVQRHPWNGIVLKEEHEGTRGKGGDE